MKGKAVGLGWLALFLGYWAWRFAGIVGIALLVAAYVLLAVWVGRARQG